jgi:hypothetical protein
MSDNPHPEDRRWSLTVSWTLIGLLAFSVFVGLIALPLAQAPNAGIDPWSAICRAVGVRPGTPAQRQPTYDATAEPVSHVRWTPQTLRTLASADPRPGASSPAQSASTAMASGASRRPGPTPILPASRRRRSTSSSTTSVRAPATTPR